MRKRFPRPFRLEANHQIQVLGSPFFRNQTAYIVGRIINGIQTYPFVVPVKHDERGKLYFDALLMDEADLAILFSANRAYFLVDMEVPADYVNFLRAMLADKTAAELYTMIGLQKAGKNLFYRDFLHHLKHSRDKFIVAPGIKGLVMTVFTLPSYPYVFKVIKDKIAASKNTDRQKVKQKYTLVKHHDRVGRMTDVLEYSDVAFPRDRFADELVAELTAVAPSVVEFDGDYVVVKHLYIERRVHSAQPLPRAGRRRAARARDARVRRPRSGSLPQSTSSPAICCSRTSASPASGAWCSTITTRSNISSTATSAGSRRRRPGGTTCRSDVWYGVGAHDIFPEEFATFLLTDPRTRDCFIAAHAELLDAAWWQAMQNEIRTGRLVEVLSYPDSVRFITQSH